MLVPLMVLALVIEELLVDAALFAHLAVLVILPFHRWCSASYQTSEILYRNRRFCR